MMRKCEYLRDLHASLKILKMSTKYSMLLFINGPPIEEYEHSVYISYIKQSWSYAYGQINNKII